MRRFVLRSPADLVAATRYLLGFHPDYSVVVVAFRDRKCVGAARLDLPEPAERPPAALGHALVAPMRCRGATTVAVLGYGPAAMVDPVVPVVRRAARRYGLLIKDVLRVDDGRCWSYICHDRRCCPPEGIPVYQVADRATPTFDDARAAAGLAMPGHVPGSPHPAADVERAGEVNTHAAEERAGGQEVP